MSIRAAKQLVQISAPTSRKFDSLALQRSLRICIEKMEPVHSNAVFPGGSDGKESGCNAGDLGLIPESGRSSGEGNGNPLQYSCLENPMDRRAWRETVHGVTELDTIE